METWIPDLTDISLEELWELDLEALPEGVLADLLSRVDRPSSQIAGSSGS